MSIKIYTLCFVLRDGQVLLGMKKRGFGAGRWNGFGGKIEPGETIEEAAKRETLEECGITVKQMEAVGIHEFVFADRPDELLEVHVFRVDVYSGEPIETEEMQPKWFAYGAIPYADMWPDDQYWFPLFLTGKHFKTRFLFGAKDSVLEQSVTEL